MTRPIAVLRPEPGNGRTADRLAALGATVIRRPLFAIVPVAWTPPDPAGFDALVLTSANAVRHADIAATSLARLPVWAVGSATAAAARAAGLRVVATGDSDGRALLDAAGAAGVRRALLLTGRDRAVAGHPVLHAIRAVYASEAVAGVDAALLDGTVALVHSQRAARQLAMLAEAREAIAVAAIAPAVADALGAGWRAVAVAARPDDPAVIAAAIALADA